MLSSFCYPVGAASAELVTEDAGAAVGGVWPRKIDSISLAPSCGVGVRVCARVDTNLLPTKTSV